VDGTFGFSDKVTYVGKGPGSWKHEALGTEAAEGDVPYKFNADGSLHLHLLSATASRILGGCSDQARNNQISSAAF
jgi:hypothetical protein